MKPTFETTKWKKAACFAYIAMHVGVLTMTVTLPLILLAMGESSNMGHHCFSMKSLQYWLIGVGCFTLFTETLVVIATMRRNKVFQVFVIILLSILALLTLGMFILGLVDHDGRKTYLSNTWNDMSYETKYFLQRYYSCCGFENEDEWTSMVAPVDKSCFVIESENVTWSSGCYERVILPYLKPSVEENQSIGTGKINPFVVFFYVSPICILFAQIASILACISAMISERNENKNIVTENIDQKNESGAYDDDAGKNEIDHDIGKGDNGMQSKLTKNETDEFIGDSKVELENSEKTLSCMTMAEHLSYAFGNAFFWLGVRVGRHPKLTILYSLLLAGSFSIGILQIYDVVMSDREGFLRSSNPVVQEFNLMKRTFLSTRREHAIIVVSDDNILTKQNFLTTLDIYNSVQELTSSSGQNFSSICVKIYEDCRQRSLFEFWSYNNTALRNLSMSEILDKVNSEPLTSPVFYDDVIVTQILGDIEKDSEGKIISAKSHLLYFATIEPDLNWEELFVKVGRQSYNGVNVYVQTESSYDVESMSEYTAELPLLSVGFVIIFWYLVATAGKFSLLEHKIYVSLGGVTASVLSIGAGTGLACALGLKWTSLHLAAPFLVLAIGVDDMFVLISTWEYIENDENYKNLPVAEKAGHALKTAGAAITVTSVTDLVAFGMGATSGIGGLASFSVFVAVSIILLFFLECTFFVACLVLDYNRREQRYDACLACCYKHKETYKPGKCSRLQISQTLLENYLGQIVMKVPFAITLILVSLGTAGIMAWQCYHLEVKFNLDWFLPIDSYLIDYGEQFQLFYDVGEDGSALVIDADFYADRAKLHILYEKLKNNTNIDNNYLYSWFESYVLWALYFKGITDVYAEDAYEGATEFYSSVQEFLQSLGSVYIHEIVFKSGVIIGSRFEYRHESSVEGVDTVESIVEDCNDVGFSGYAFPYGRAYAAHEIARITQEEIYRNLGITLLCVFLMILPMLLSLQMAIWVALCVIITTIEVGGSMYLAGLSINILTTITLLLSVGLAVDYSTHVGHKFLSIYGTRKMRIQGTLGQIGYAVFNGGFTSFLVVVLLNGTKAYVYRVFFVSFSAVIIFGLWNALVFLPCILGLVGPSPHANATEAKLTTRMSKRHSLERTTSYQLQEI